MSLKVLEIGGITLPTLASLNATQVYESLERASMPEMGDGSAIKRVYAGTANRVRTVVSGQGPIPPGLDGLDFTQPLLIKCAAEREITSAAFNIVIPADRRSDAGYTPWGRAFVGSQPVPTAVNMNGDTAELTQVAGATGYQVLWYPQFTALVEGGLQKQVDIDGAVVSWQLSMRQQ